MLPSTKANCEWLKALNNSPRNSSLKRSLTGVTFKKAISQLLIPGPQQMVRGALPIVPRPTVASVNVLGSKAALMGTHGVGGSVAFTPAVGPVPSAHVLFRGSIRRNVAPGLKFGWPGVSKSKLDCSSMSSCSVMRMGKPDWNVVIPDNAQPLRAFPLKPSYLGTGNSQ